ncbi:MAG TPA: BatA domain-containing protein, partial [Chryseosolibacter sp.]|nr:BatA domain-containing protein [Chryseosolibacter sp.]
SWLWSLTALMLPIAIHLLSRKEGRTVYIGSLRHLTDSDTAQFRSIRLNELLLLLLRMGIIVVLVLIFSGFEINLNAVRGNRWLLLEKGVEKDSRYAGIIDSLVRDGYEGHWLADGFPAIKDSTNVAISTHYRELIDKLPDEQLSGVVVISYNHATLFKGQAAPLPKKVRWLQAEFAAHTVPVENVLLPGDSMLVRKMTTSMEGTSFVTALKAGRENLAGNAFTRNRISVNVLIYHDGKFSYDLDVVRAAVHAVDGVVPDQVTCKILDTHEPLRPDAHLVIWLSVSQVPFRHANIIALRPCGGPALPLIAVADTTNLPCRVEHSVKWVITQHLTQENSLQERLTLALAKIIGEFLPKAEFIDRRPIPNEAAFAAEAPTRHGKKKRPPNSPQAGLIPAILLLLLLVAERFVSLKRNQ